MTEINYQRMWNTLKRLISRGEFLGVFIINPVKPLIHMNEIEELEAAAQQMESERECLEE
ncbi:hypothetical protein ES703_124480 [subsurface metagenome]